MRMKKYSIFVLSSALLVMSTCFAAFGEISVDEEHFPDYSFRLIVSYDVDSNGDGVLSDKEIANFTYLSLYPHNPSSLDGIEYLTGLTYLSCYGCSLTELDVSGCTALEELHCSFNSLTSLNVNGAVSLKIIDCAYNELETLDLSGCPNLETLECNNNKLAALDFSSNKVLTELRCDDNLLEILDLSGCPNLETLDCSYNKLAALDLSRNVALTELNCNDNVLETLNLNGCTSLVRLNLYGNKLTALDLTSNTALEYFSCGVNELEALDLSSNTALEELYCYNNNITALDLSRNTALRILRCGSNPMEALNIKGCTSLVRLDCSSSRLQSLDLSGCTNLLFLDCSSNRLTALDPSVCPKIAIVICTFNSLTSINTLACPALAVLDYEDGINTVNAVINPEITNKTVAINAENFPDPVFREYVSSNFDVYDRDGYLSPYERARATYISLEDEELSSLKGIEYITALGSLYCGNNKLTELDLSGNSLLSSLSCSGNNLSALDLSNNSLLSYLDCKNNILSALNLSNNLRLSSLNCDSNDLAALDLSNNYRLSVLHCSRNRIASLILNEHAPMTELACSRNRIPSLRVNCYPALETLYCNSNDITDLDISGLAVLKNCSCHENPMRTLKADDCTKLEDLSCWKMDLTSLSVKNCTALGYLLCYSNKLTELDISTNPNLKVLGCWDNLITRLDVSGSGLQSLMCAENPMTELLVRNCTDLQYLYCEQCELVELDISGCPYLENLSCYDNSLSALDVSGSKGLQILRCWDNNLQALDVSMCPELIWLMCSGNQLKTLDVSANTKLLELLCGRNQLRTLDLRKNTELVTLLCSSNQISALDLRNNALLEELSCSNNQIIDLDLSGCPALYELECSANYINTLDLTHNPELRRLYCRYTVIRSLDVSGCPNLYRLECSRGNLTMLDLTSNDSSLWAVDLTGHSFEGLELTNTNSEEYPYKTDMRSYVSENFSRVSNVHAFDRTGAEINALFSQYEGAVYFASMPVRMTYDYSTGLTGYGQTGTMTVTVSVPTRSFIYLPKVEPAVQGRDEYVDVPQVSFETNSDTGRTTPIITFALHYVGHASLYDIINDSDDVSFDIVYVPYERETHDTQETPEIPDIPASTDVPTSTDIPANYSVGSSSGGGCNSGLGLLAAILTLPFLRRKRVMFLLVLLLVCSTAYAENIHTSDYTLPIQLENYSPAGTCSTNFQLSPELKNTVAKIRGISSDRVHSYSEIASAGTWEVQPSDLYNLSRNGEYGGVVLPVTSGAASRDYYVIMCVFSNDIQPGEMISLQGFEVSADTMQTVYTKEHSYSAARWVTLDDQLNRIEYVPENRRIYLAVSFAPEYINTGILTVIRGEYITENNPLERLDDDIAKRIAADLGISPDKLQYISRAYIGDPREPTQAMQTYMKSSDMEIILNMPTVSIDEGYEGMYFSYELPNDIWEQVKGKSLSEYPIFALNDSENSGAGRVKSSSIATGVISVFDLNGWKMDNFGAKEILIAGLLSAGKPFSLYLAKMLIMLLLGGCSSGINPSIIPVIILSLIVLKFPRKH